MTPLNDSPQLSGFENTSTTILKDTDKLGGLEDTSTTILKDTDKLGGFENTSISILKDTETLDDLECNGMSIISDKDLYCFTSDSVRLANLVKAPAKTKLVDLCSGGGIIPILIAAKTPILEIVGVELQPELADMATRSCALNHLEDRVSFRCRDLKNCEQELGGGHYDIVTCNPPYYKAGTGDIRENASVALARHELATDISTIIATAQKLLKFGGKLYLVHKCERLAEIIALLVANKLEPKELFLYSPTVAKACDTFIVIAKSGARAGMTVRNIIIDDTTN